MTSRKVKETKAKTLRGEKLSEDDLNKIAGGGNYFGTDKSETIFGSSGDDFIRGGEGNDQLHGGGGSDIIEGNDGNDWLDGGGRDHANDFLFGGDGNDMMGWAQGAGNDFFDGGQGNDQIHLFFLGTTVEQAFSSGQYTIELTDANGNAIAITDDMYDDNGNLHLPAGTNGVITAPSGETLTFENVEFIRGRS